MKILILSQPNAVSPGLHQAICQELLIRDHQLILVLNKHQKSPTSCWINDGQSLVKTLSLVWNKSRYKHQIKVLRHDNRLEYLSLIEDVAHTDNNIDIVLVYEPGILIRNSADIIIRNWPNTLFAIAYRVYGRGQTCKVYTGPQVDVSLVLTGDNSVVISTAKTMESTLGSNQDLAKAIADALELRRGIKTINQKVLK